MIRHYPRMVRQKSHAAKRQRGLSLTPDLYDRIQDEANKYGRTWNETVELVLLRAFPSQENLRDPQSRLEYEAIRDGLMEVEKEEAK